MIVDMGAVAPEDEAAWEAYVARAPATIAQYGGTYLVRGGKVDVMEGNWSPSGIVIAEFPNMNAVRNWYGSPEYAPCLKIREASGLSRKMICADGVGSVDSDNLMGSNIPR